MTSRRQCLGGVLVNVLLPPPPSGNPVSAPGVVCVVVVCITVTHLTHLV